MRDARDRTTECTVKRRYAIMFREDRKINVKLLYCIVLEQLMMLKASQLEHIAGTPVMS